MTSISSYSPFSSLSGSSLLSTGYSSPFGTASLFGTSSLSQPSWLQEPVAAAGTTASLFLPPSNSSLSGNTLLSLLTPDQYSSPATDLLSSANAWSSSTAASAYSNSLFGTLESSQNYSNSVFDTSMAANLAAAESVVATPGGGSTNLLA